jgi:hypothetical protein
MPPAGERLSPDLLHQRGSLADSLDKMEAEKVPSEEGAVFEIDAKKCSFALE